jgi:hypothetical protein
MSDKPEPTAEEKMADALPANAKYVAAHQNSRRGLPVPAVFDSAVFGVGTAPSGSHPSVDASDSFRTNERHARTYFAQRVSDVRAGQWATQTFVKHIWRTDVSQQWRRRPGPRGRGSMA